MSLCDAFHEDVILQRLHMHREHKPNTCSHSIYVCRMLYCLYKNCSRRNSVATCNKWTIPAANKTGCFSWISKTSFPTQMNHNQLPHPNWGRQSKLLGNLKIDRSEGERESRVHYFHWNCDWRERHEGKAVRPRSRLVVRGRRISGAGDGEGKEGDVGDDSPCACCWLTAFAA